MTLPRELFLSRDQDGYFVSSRVLEAFDGLTQPFLSRASLSLKDSISFEGPFDAAEVKWKQDMNQPLDIRFQNELGEFIRIGLRPEQGLIEVDRSHSGKTDFSEAFADKIHTAPYGAREAEVDVRMILDRASLELFIDDGRYVMTEIFFPNSAFTEMILSAPADAVLEDLNINKVSNTWNNE